MSTRIETQYNADYALSYLWQYDKAELLKALMDRIAQNSLPKDDDGVDMLEYWYNHVFDLANLRAKKENEEKESDTLGLNIWGRILGIVRVGSYREKVDDAIVPHYVPFDDAHYKRLILGRIFLLNSNASIGAINAYLHILFPDKLAFVVDNHNMTITYVLYFTPSEQDKAMLMSENFSPTPTGVLVDYISNDVTHLFGFDGSKLKNERNEVEGQPGQYVADPTEPGYYDAEHGGTFIEFIT